MPRIQITISASSRYNKIEVWQLMDNQDFMLDGR